MIERMLSVKDAAKRCGLSDTSFEKLVERNVAPKPVRHPDVKRNLWDVKELDKYLDKISGVIPTSSHRKISLQERLANAT